MDIELLRLLSRTLCSGHLAGKSGPELGQLLGVESDYPTWAFAKKCYDEPAFMLRVCPASCGVCTTLESKDEL